MIIKEVFSWGKAILFGILVAFLFRSFLFMPTMVYGESMQPTLADQDRVLISKLSEINHFDIVVFQAPDHNGDYYIKRVIGLPGDEIEYKADVLYINGEAYDEEYLREQKQKYALGLFTGDFTLNELTGKTRVPEDSLFVMGDNRIISKDSRFFGFISYHDVLGEVKLRYYPIKDVNILN